MLYQSHPHFELDRSVSHRRPRPVVEPVTPGLSPIGSVGPPIEIRTLGSFEVRLAGASITPHGKDACLLQVLIALGSRDVALARLADELWPDAEGPQARQALDTTLYRLRRRLRLPGAVTLRDGRLSLAPSCWVDCCAFEQLTRGGVSGPDDDRVPVALDLYRGRLLAGFDEQPWLEPLRGKLHARYRRLVAEAGLGCERAGATESALELYGRALDVDDVHEPFHRGVIRCLSHLGRTSEAKDALERCRRRLLGGLGTEPARATEALVLPSLALIGARSRTAPPSSLSFAARR